jgi:hypothetical protein
MKTENNKKNPSKCVVEVNCKATAALHDQVMAELEEEDKSLQELLDDDKNDQTIGN